MEKAYRKILARRNEHLQEELTWSKELAKSLVREKVLSRECVQEIERENGQSNRVYRLLAKLPQQTSPGVFEGFHRTLCHTQQEELAQLLHYDRRQIVWDFQSCGEVHSVAEYVHVIEEQLLPRLAGAEDEFVETAVLKELSMRFRQLIRYTEQHLYRDQKFRRDILKRFRLPDQNLQSDDTINLMQPSGFDILAERELKQDDVTVERLTKFVQMLKEDNQLLQDNLDRMKHTMKCQTEAEWEKSIPRDKDIADRQKEQKIRLLEETIKEQDMQLLMYKEEKKMQVDFVPISKAELEELFNDMYPYLRRSSDIDSAVLSTAKTSRSSKYMVRLQGDLSFLLTQIDTLRARVQQITRHVTELEKDRALISNSLQLKEVSPERWAEQVLNTFSELEEDKTNMQTEIDSLQKRIIVMGEEQRFLMNRIDELVSAQGETTEELIETAHVPKPRLRKSSAISLTRPKPVAETKQRRSTVATTTNKCRPLSRQTKQESDKGSNSPRETGKAAVKIRTLSLGMHPYGHH